MTQFKRKKSGFPHRNLLLGLQGVLLLGLLFWIGLWSTSTDKRTDGVDISTTLSQQQQQAPEIAPQQQSTLSDSGAAADPIQTIEDSEIEEDEQNDDNMDDDESAAGDDDAAEDDEDNTDDQITDADMEDTDNNPDELAEEAVERRRLSPAERHEHLDDGSEQLESKRFVMELSNLVGGDGPSGRVVLETRPAWAPIGAAHFHELVATGFYNEARFFRVVDNFIVQFGIAGDPKVQEKWDDDVLEDDPVHKTNARGTITYATAGPNTRTTQLFVNTRHNGNAFLDKQGFAPFAEIVEGMEFIDAIDNEYGEEPDQDAIERNGNEYLNQHFPHLSYIVTLKEDGGDSPGVGTP